ncbi:hypothetical protein DM02DRAFT_621044 [Periconia macrospinosa]|uniref:Uncharacterized protein n=1 Tax=Periconia macrospinosa TaxID=97972 RepID=A0A2V1CY17_9PLEO|nr:hypothetical protein DM02DRAFT_621044 [Periconia macrospinosa]
MLVGSPAFSLPTYVQQIDQSKRQTTSKHDGLPTQTDQHQSTSPTAFASSTSFFETKSPMEPSFHSPSTNILTLAPTSLSSVTVDIEAVLGVQKDLSGVTAKLLVVTLTGGQNRFQLVCEDWRSIQKWGSVWRRRLEELIGDQACQHATRLSKTGGAGGHAIFVPEKVLEDIVRSSEARQTLLDGGSILYQPVQG